MSKRFAITGVSGYIAPRHLKAIKNTGNTLVAALDPHDAAGIMDQYFPHADFFTEPERFDRHLEKLKRLGETQKIDFVSICSPNYLHDAHIRMALRIGAHAICEKPLVLNPWNLDLLKDLEIEYNKKIYSVLQLRLHPAIVALKKEYEFITQRQEIELTYITSRGKWYQYAWKGNKERSGGLATNIGIHFFDMLLWIFGKCVDFNVFRDSPTTTSGFLQLERANVKWFLSIDDNNLPAKSIKQGHTTFRSIKINSKELEFSEGFTDLHTEIYKDILSGGGFGLEDSRPAIDLVYKIRNAPLSIPRE